MSDAISEKIKGNWTQLKGKIKEKWGELTEDDLLVLEGKSDQLAGRLQERYGYEKAQADKEIQSFLNDNNLN